MANDALLNIAITATPESFDYMAAMYRNEKFSDFNFIVDGELLPAHKAIVANKSPYFEALIRNSDGKTVYINETGVYIFTEILKYIYTGKYVMSVPDVETALNIMILAHQYLLFDLVDLILIYLYDFINFKTVVRFLNIGCMCDLVELKDRCCLFLENNYKKFISEIDYQNFLECSMVCLLQRDTFVLPETDIFGMVVSWREAQKKNKPEDPVLGCVRFTDMSIQDIILIVEPTKLLSHQRILAIILEISNRNQKFRTRQVKPITVNNVNLNTKEYKARYITGCPASDAVDNAVYECEIDDPNGITLKLRGIYQINNIKFCFPSPPGRTRVYRYYVETSRDNENWTKIIDYSSYDCRKRQDLYFSPVFVKYIRFVGTFTDYMKQAFIIDAVEVYYKTENVKDFKNGIIRPDFKTPLCSLKPTLVTGIITGNQLSATCDTSTSIFIELNQPYLVSRLHFTLESGMKHVISTSYDRIYWHPIMEFDEIKYMSNDVSTIHYISPPITAYSPLHKKSCYKNQHTITFYGTRVVVYIRIQPAPPKFEIGCFNAFYLS